MCPQLVSPIAIITKTQASGGFVFIISPNELRDALKTTEKLGYFGRQIDQ